MKRFGLVAVAVAVLAWCAVGARAQAEAAREGGAAVSEAPAGHEVAAHEGGAHDAGPVVPDFRHRWPAPTLFLIGISFFMALVIGLIVRSHAPPEMPPTHSHDEPPGASHHHGESGTINPIPEDVARLEQGDDHGHGHHH